MSRKGAKNRTLGRKLRSTGTKATRRVARGHNPSSELKRQLEARTRELGEARELLGEALEQRAATSEVLKVISTSPNELQPVLDSIVATAADLCEADFAMIHTLEGGRFRLVAANKAKPDYVKWLAQHPPAADRGSASGRVVSERATVHIPDILADPEYTRSELQKRGGQRTVLGVPLMRKGMPIGVIALHRAKVRPFTDKQIDLVETFADQAVIAIENVRLFDEVQARTRELTELLEQRTATSEVLQVISSSPGELEPVFNAMLENAQRICEAKFGFLWRIENGNARIVSKRGIPSALDEYLQRGPHRPPLNWPGPLTAINRVVQSRETVHISDYRLDPSYLDRDPLTVAAVELGGARTLLVVPMLKDDELMGAIGIYRLEVRPFTDKQIELVQSFANQAVIAIENTRLLNELRQRTDDLSEALEQQTATSKVLQVISNSPGELQPVFEAMLENAVRICQADFGTLLRSEGDAFRALALHGAPPAYAEERRRNPVVPASPGAGLARMMAIKRTVQIADTHAEPAYRTDPGRARFVETSGARTAIFVPMLKENELVGAIVIYRQQVRPFTDKQIQVVQNFAAQAVIAIENTRLLNELRQRTDDLSESLEQQTATSQVLQVISSSPGQVQPVFQAMLEKATRVCGSKFGTMYLREGDDAYRAVAMYGAPAAYTQARLGEQRHPGPGTGLGRVVRTKQVVHVADILAEQAYGERDPMRAAAIELGGVRTLLCVPMLKENELIGAIAIYRAQVRPFTAKQIELVTTFAAQAVIAIENTRLLNELRELLAQQTATSEVLHVISSSPGELEPVFRAMLERATSICEAKFGILHLCEDGACRSAVWVGASAELAEYLSRRGWFRPTAEFHSASQCGPGRSCIPPTIPPTGPPRRLRGWAAPGHTFWYPCSRTMSWWERSRSIARRCSPSPTNRSG